jgi:hypothetical protein
MTYGNSFETMIEDQEFKLTKSDEQYRNFVFDCIGDINSCVLGKQER